MAKSTSRVRGEGGRFETKQEEPAPETKEQPLPETEAVKESMSPEEVPVIPISSYTITRGTEKVAETETAEGKEKEKEITPTIEKEQKEEPTTELKVEPMPETDVVTEIEDKKEVAPYIEMEQKEPTSELKEEQAPKTEKGIDSEIEKDTPGISEPTFLVIKKRVKEAKLITEKGVEIVRTRIGKYIISDMMKKTVIASMSAIKHPVNTVSNFDKKVTKAMKKLTLFDFKNNNPNSKGNNSKSENSNNKTVVIVLNADRNITKSAKALMNTIIK